MSVYRYKAWEDQAFLETLFLPFEPPLIDLRVIFAPFPLSIFLYFCVSICFCHDTFSCSGILVSISFEGQGDQGGLSTAVCHTLCRKTNFLPKFNNVCVLWEVILYGGTNREVLCVSHIVYVRGSWKKCGKIRSEEKSCLCQCDIQSYSGVMLIDNKHVRVN